MDEQLFHPAMTVDEVLRAHPKARWVLVSYHLLGCSHCSKSEGETLTRVAETYRLPLDRLLHDLNSLEPPAAN